MIAKIIDNHWIYLEQLTVDTEHLVISHFSVRDPKSYYLNTEAGWDGWYRRYNQNKQRLALPFLKELQICCDKHNIPLDIHDLRSAPINPSPDLVTPDMLSGVTLEQYQIEAIRSTCSNEIGCVLSCTGSGKTEMMCAVTKLHNINTVIITEQIQVLTQIVERLQIRDAVKDEVGMFCHGHMPDGNQVIVGSIQSLLSPDKPERKDFNLTKNQVLKKLLKYITDENLEEMQHFMPMVLATKLIENPEGIQVLEGKYFEVIKSYFIEQEYQRRIKWFKTRNIHANQIQDMVKLADMILVDEADLACTAQYNSLFKRIFNGRRRYGFSGTFMDPKKPVQNLYLKENLGNIIYAVNRSEVEARGRIIPIKAYFIGIGMEGDRKDYRTYDIAMNEEIINNEALHQKIKKLATGFHGEGKLILLDTMSIGNLGEALEKIIPNSVFLWNKSSIAKRRKSLELFENRKIECLISGRILKRGTDLKGGIENLIVLGGGKQWSSFNQIVGRSVRKNTKGWARVFFFFHFSNRYLYKHSIESLKAVLDMGYQTTVIIGNKQIEGNKFVKSRYRLPS